MNTDELVSLLATGSEPVDTRLPMRRYLIAVVAGTAVATLLTAEWLGFRPTLVRDLSVPMFWAKEAFCAGLGAAGLVAVARLARPGSRLGWVRAAVAAPVIAMWLLADLPDRQRLPIIHMKIEGLSVAETARLIGMSQSAVKVGVHRGLTALAGKIRSES